MLIGEKAERQYDPVDVNLPEADPDASSASLCLFQTKIDLFSLFSEAVHFTLVCFG
ncbi:hypothetical protein DPMN_078852 [Dreissena polymorpha]|uniref:Uncharacterized protein n=1 Tax=Dreissena polymorpha TaxID=45954 RepID=A0A9D3YRY5_DREPO|nr:hypothetical protein DPMN_078852 [Dreissena polymorpha]